MLHFDATRAVEPLDCTVLHAWTLDRLPTLAPVESARRHRPLAWRREQLHALWEFVADTSFKGSWSLIRIDRRGQGGSVWRGATGLREWCDDIAGILDAEGFSRAVVGGHCLGANIAVEFVARHPVCISGLVLIEPLPRR